MNLPKHVVIIPDGNRRWAKKRGLPSFIGHREGAKTTEKLLLASFDLGIENLTFWGCSVDNVTKRSRVEVKFLMKIFSGSGKKGDAVGNRRNQKIQKAPADFSDGLQRVGRDDGGD